MKMSIKKSASLFAVILIFYNISYSQEKLNNLTTPASPASIVLGLQPGAIITPKSYKTLEASFYSNFLTNSIGVSIPNDLAFEITPYWIFNSNVSFDDWVNPKSFINGQVFRNSSFSAAITQKFKLQDSSLTNSLAIGYRTTLFWGSSSDAKKKLEYVKNDSVKSKIVNIMSHRSKSILYDSTHDSIKGFVDAVKRNLNCIRPINNDEFIKRLDVFVQQEEIKEKKKFVAAAENFILNERVANKNRFMELVNEYVKIKEMLAKRILLSYIIHVITKEAQNKSIDFNFKKILCELKKEEKELQFNGDSYDDYAKDLENKIKLLLMYDEEYNTFKNYLKNREGLSIDFAFAGMLNFPTNEFEFSYVPKYSAWITPSYRFSNNDNHLKILGVLRYEHYNTNYYGTYFSGTKYFQNNLDYGASIQHVLDKFTMQFEFVGRYAYLEKITGTDSNGNKGYSEENSCDLQYIFTLSFNISDQVALSYNFGRRFKSETNQNGTFLSQISLNLGFGGPPETDAATK